MAGYTKMRERAPDRLAAISERVARYDAELRAARLDPETLKPMNPAKVRSPDPGIVKELDLMVLALPLALIGTIVNYPVYRLVGFITARLSRDDDDIVATIKMIAGALLFPLMWIVLAVVAGIYWGWWAGLAALILAPLSGYAALVFFERLSRSIGGARATIMSRVQRWGYLKLVAERSAIRDEIFALADEFETPA
jgi:hypothetical protein